MHRTGRYLLLSFASLTIMALVGAWYFRGVPTYRERRWARADEKQRAAQRSMRRLDVAAFREDVARRKAKAAALAERGSATPYKPPEVRGTLALLFGEQGCILGPREICDSLSPLIVDCDRGEGTSCLAVGQYLQDTPPRALVSVLFFDEACKHGETAGCARMEELKRPSHRPCKGDPIACARQGMRDHDSALLDEACTAGVADACAMMTAQVKDPEIARGYLERSCQLGNVLGCIGLGNRLSTDCKQDCYAPDPEQAKAASAIGCAAGWAEACK